jgi:thioredoxin-like negative regulator of GroEL
MVKRVTFSTDNSRGAAEVGADKVFAKKMESLEDWNAIMDSLVPVVFQCSTSWCRPCQVLKPIMEQAVAKHDGQVIFYYIDIEKFPEVGDMLQVSSVPHVFAV